MKSVKVFCIISIALYIFTSQGMVFAQSGIPPADIERVGQSGWQFLKINGDSRISSLAGTAAATGHGDASSVFGNPSALTDIKYTEVFFHNTNWIADIGHQSLVAAKNLGDLGIVALSVVSVDYGDIPETINSPTPAGDRTNAVVTGNYFSASDIAIGITYARLVTDKLSLGGSVRWIQEQIAELNMTSWAFDFGTTYYTGYKTLRIGMIARNFGPDSRLVGWSEEFQAEAEDVRMPLDFRIGIAIDLLEKDEDENIMTVSLEGTHPNDGPEKMNMGVEYSYDNLLYARVGYRFNYDEESLTFGGGVRYSINDIGVRVNYAYLDFGDLKQVHTISIGLELDY